MDIFEAILKHADQIASIGGTSLLIAVLLWDKVVQSKRYDKNVKANNETMMALNEAWNRLNCTLTDLSANLKYNLFCPILTQNKKEPICKNKSEPH